MDRGVVQRRQVSTAAGRLDRIRLPWLVRAGIAMLVVGAAVAAIGSAGRAADDVVVSVRVAASSDDAEEFSDGFIYLNSSDIELVTDNTSLQTVGLRFTGLAIPPGAEITTAWIQFTTDEPSTTPTNLVIAAHKTTNAPTFSPTQPITTRPTAATTTWQPAPWPTIGQSTTTQRTPDIAGLIQELVNQPTWTLTSPIAVIITGTGTAESHDGDPNAAALLHITYRTPPGFNTPPTVTATSTNTTTDQPATITDDGLPNPPAQTTSTWTQTAGPAPTTITNPNQPTTTVTITQPGTYTYTLTATDTEHTATATTTLSATTPPSPGGTVRFAAIGDYGDGGTKEAQSSAMIDAWGPDIVVTAGDNSYGGGTLDRKIGLYYHEYIGGYTGIYGPGSPVNRFFPSLGNHDYADGGGLAEYLDFFDLPGVGVETSGTSGNERYYDFIVGPVHFFAVNSNIEEPDGTGAASAQASWLQAQMATSTARWQVVLFHHAAYVSGGQTEGMRWPYAAWGADMVIAAHRHFYERLAIDGIPYIVSGLGVNSDDGPQTNPASQAFYTGNDTGALLVIACDTAMHLEYRTVNVGQVDALDIGGAACAQP